MRKYLILLVFMMFIICIPSSFAEDNEIQVTNEINTSNNITYDYYLIPEEEGLDNYLIKSINGSLLCDNDNNPYKIVNYSTKGGSYYVHLDLRNIINELNITSNVTFKLLGNDWVSFRDDGSVHIPTVNTGPTPLPVVTVNASNLTKTFGDNETFHGYVNETNTYITIHILLTRLNTGASKFYEVNTDTNGYFELPINLAPGTYKADILKLVVYGGLSIFDSYDIFILDSSLNDTQTFLSYGANLFRNGFKGNNLTGVLKTQDNKFLSNQVIGVEITRNSNGASKTYFVTTNANGVYSLPINLAEEGSYTFRCAYKGTEEYKGSSYMLTKSFGLLIPVIPKIDNTVQIL